MSNLTTKLIGTTPIGGAVEAQAIDFGGDFLLRDADLVGNADGTTFTFSAWVYTGKDPIDNSSQAVFAIGQNRFKVVIQSRTTQGGNVIFLQGRNSINSVRIELEGNDILPTNTWLHILISCDLSGPRDIYVNDVTYSFSTITYLNSSINFTQGSLRVGENFSAATKWIGRLSNVYLDYTYRDLSVEANRRLFVDYDDDGGLIPASGQASLSPILYLPMDDPDDPGRNDGTGGDFTLNGTIARSGRGPNQYNAPASTFDGSADYLSTSSVTGLADGKQVTVCFGFKTNQNTDYPFEFSSQRAFAKVESGSNLLIYFRNAAGSNVATVQVNGVLRPDKWHSVQFSVNLSGADTSKRHIIVDGVDVTGSGSWTFTDDTMDLTEYPLDIGRGANDADYFSGELSDLYFDTTYIDLSADNPFYDTETNKPKFLGENGELPTGSSPLIYLPLRGDDAGNNKGTGGDFTVNSGPYVGARGPSEFWGESAELDSSTPKLLSSSAVTGITDTKTFTFVMTFRLNTTSSQHHFVKLAGYDIRIRWFDVSNSIQISGKNDLGTGVLDVTFPFSGDINWHTLAMSFDMADSNKSHMVFDGVDQTLTLSTYTDDSVAFSSYTPFRIGDDSTVGLDGKIGFFWFNTEYIDFSQEANRLKFFDAFGYPVDLGEDGSLPTGNQPLIYLNNDFHLGTNLGSGGDFTPVNTPTDGGFVKG